MHYIQNQCAIMNHDGDALLSFVIESSLLMEPHVFSMAGDNDFLQRWPRVWISFVDDQAKDPQRLQAFESHLIRILKSKTSKSDVPSNWPDSLRQYILQCQKLPLDRTVMEPQDRPVRVSLYS